MALFTHQQHAVYIRSNWADAWQLQQYLYCDRCDFTLAPEMPEASFTWDYGKVMGHGANAFVDRTPLDVLNNYVKVVINQSDGSTREWYGVFIDSGQSRGGDYAAHVIGTGRQEIVARGLEMALHRTPIKTSQVLDVSGNPYEINSAQGFNLGGGNDHDSVEARNMEYGDDGIPRFCSSLDNASTWSNFDVLYYLMQFYSPRNGVGTDNLGFTFDIAAVQNDLMKAQAPAMHVHGMTFKQILDKICDRRRLMSWFVEVVGNTPTIRIVTFNDVALNMPSGEFVVANQNPITWYFEDDAQIKMATVSETDATQFTRVTTQGDKCTGTFTTNYPTIESDWTDANVTLYEAGATAMAGYAALDDFAKQHANQRARLRDELQKVWRYFRISPAWDGKANGFPTCIQPLDELKQASFWWPGLRLLQRLPLQTDQDYSNIAAVVNNAKTNTYPELRRPFVIAKEYIGDGFKYAYLERRGRGATIAETAEVGDRQWAATVRMIDTMPGLILDLHGAPQHAIAGGEFTAADDTDAADYGVESDWKDLQFTICAEFHQFAEATFPVVPNPFGDCESELLIRCPHKRCDYLAPLTVVDIDDAGELVTSGAGGWIQDDREELQNIAASAYAWYNTPRAAIELERHNLDAALPAGPGGQSVPFYLGYLVESIGNGATSKQVNAIINKLSFNLKGGILKISTAFTEFDFARGIS